ncbi:uncharacterized protein [Eleutherodactylus coqui]|uniref:uncharacterized protein n=1 Tax=Eleutherodactylus coqui TaxID=57060 RepID=UPI003462AFB1
MLIYVPPFLALLLCVPTGAISNGSYLNSGATSAPPIRGTLTSNIGAGSVDVAVSPTSAVFFIVSMTYQKSIMESSPSPTRISKSPPSKGMREITETHLIPKESTPLITAEETEEETTDPIDYSVSNTSPPSTVTPAFSTMVGTMTSPLSTTASTSSPTTSIVSPPSSPATSSPTTSIVSPPSSPATSLTMIVTMTAPSTTTAPTSSAMAGTMSYPSTKTALTSSTSTTVMTGPAPLSMTNTETPPSTAPTSTSASMSSDLVTITPRGIIGAAMPSSVMPRTSPTLKNYTKASMAANTSTAATAMETTEAFTVVRVKYTKPPQNMASNYKGRIMLRVTLAISPTGNFAVAMRELLKKTCLLLAQNISAKELTVSWKSNNMFLPCANIIKIT